MEGGSGHPTPEPHEPLCCGTSCAQPIPKASSSTFCRVLSRAGKQPNVCLEPPKPSEEQAGAVGSRHRGPLTAERQRRLCCADTPSPAVKVKSIGAKRKVFPHWVISPPEQWGSGMSCAQLTGVPQGFRWPCFLNVPLPAPTAAVSYWSQPKWCLLV